MIIVSFCSISAIIILYLFCFIRMVFPIEFPWTKVVSGGSIYNFVYTFMHQPMWRSKSVNILQLVICIWISGTIVNLYKYIRNYIRFNKYLSHLKAVEDSEILTILHNISKLKIQLVISPLISTPCCVGMINKKIVLPDKKYSMEDLQYILMHEYGHIYNRDLLIKFLINILCAIYWWNPVVYLLKKDIDQSLEIRCDEYVIRGLTLTQRADYLDVLLREFQEASGKSKIIEFKNYVSCFRSEYSSTLLERFQYVGTAKNKGYWKSQFLAYVIAGILMIFSYSFIIQTQFNPPQSDIESEEGVYEIKNDECYIYMNQNDEYVLHTKTNDIIINQDMVEQLQKDGFILKQ